jgi:2,4-diaminopentanoate dehydrogenase
MTLRVVQWTTGITGKAAVRGIVDHPLLELVGCYAYSPEKVGRDAGELCGIAPLGVIATDDVEALLALAPDCVSYMPYRPDVDHVERILDAGINVVTTMYRLAGTGYGDDVLERVEAAAQRGGSSLYASGIYPGHAPMVGLAASAMCARIDRISILESLDIRGYESERMCRSMGFDREVGDPEGPRALEEACGSFKDQIHVMARALAIELDEIRFEPQFATADETLDLGFMTIQAGRIAGFKGVISGLSGGRPVIQCQFVWKLGDAMTPSWPVEDGYVIEIDGDPRVRCRLEPLDPGPPRIGAHFEAGTTTAMPVVNAIPDVCTAPPGIVNRMQLPFVMGAHRIATHR